MFMRPRRTAHPRHCESAQAAGIDLRDVHISEPSLENLFSTYRKGVYAIELETFFGSAVTRRSRGPPQFASYAAAESFAAAVSLYIWRVMTTSGIMPAAV